MVEKILFSDFKKFPLEKRAKILLKNYSKEEVRIEMNTGDGLFTVSEPFIEAWEYAEQNKYAEIVGGTPKSGLAYKITSKGLEFMNKTL